MAQKNHTTNLTELLLQCVAQPGSHAEYAGMAVQPAHGGRSKPAAGGGEKRALRKP